MNQRIGRLYKLGKERILNLFRQTKFNIDNSPFLSKQQLNQQINIKLQQTSYGNFNKFVRISQFCVITIISYKLYNYSVSNFSFKDIFSRPQQGQAKKEEEQIEKETVKKEGEYVESEQQDENKVSLPSQKKKEIKMLVIGKTGCGKSTLINMIMNLAAEKNYDDERVIAITQKFLQPDNSFIELNCNIDVFKQRQSDVHGSQSQSQTQEPQLYGIETQDYKITIIDTPGLGDTGGDTIDESHIDAMIRSIQKLSQINVIMYVHQANDSRMTPYLKLFINKYKQILPKEFKDNLFVCFTNASIKIDAIQTLQEADILQEDKFVSFENGCLIHIDKFNIKIEALKKRQKIIQENIWKNNQEQFKDMIQTLLPYIPIQTKQMLDLRLMKKTLDKIIMEKSVAAQNCNTEKLLLMDEQNNFYDIQNKLMQIKPDDIQKEVVVTLYRKEKQKIKQMQKVKHPNNLYVTQCDTCKNLCHNPCSLKEFVKKGSSSIKSCLAFESKDYCLKCKHHFEEHGHQREYDQEVIVEREIEIPYQKKEIQVNTTIQQKKQQLEKQKDQLQEKINNKNENIKSLDDQIRQNVKEIAYLFNTLQRRALISENYDTHIEFMKYQIEAVKNDKNLTQKKKDDIIIEMKKQQQIYEQYKSEIEQCLKQNKDINNILTDKQIQQLQEKGELIYQQLTKDQQNKDKMIQLEIKQDSEELGDKKVRYY